MLQNVAILDDDLDLMKEVQEKLRVNGLSVRAFSTRNDFKQTVESGDHFDAVILDWYLEDPTDSNIAKLVLEDLRESYFVPVLVYTDQRDVAEAEIPRLAGPFNRCGIVDKETTDVDALGRELERWYAGTMSARLASIWRNARRKAFEQTIYELDAIEGQDFQRTLRHLLTVEDAQTPDVDHALEFLERYVGRKVVAHSAFRQLLNQELEQALRNLPARGQQQAVLVNAHRFGPISDRIVRTGDVVRVKNEAQARVMYAVVLTPACDLDQCKCFELRLVLAEERDAQNRSSEWKMSCVRIGNAFVNFALNFHQTFFVTNTSLGHTAEERRGRLITYDHQFRDAMGGIVLLEPICRLDDPYRADLLQKYASHASRVGVPD